MTNLREIYKCDVCGNLVEVVYNSQGELVCCGQPMTKLEAKTEDQGSEKHVPVIEKLENGIKVKVGSVQHPMEEAHYITCIEVLTDTKVCRQELKPGDVPEGTFSCISLEEVVEVREYCNVHGLWKKA